MRVVVSLALVVLIQLGRGTFAADLPPDATAAIPANAVRDVVVMAEGAEENKLPAHWLPEGYALEVAARPPLVTHPIMGCLDDRGRLFVGDAVGVNWNKAQLESHPPNRVLMLEDLDGDGQFDQSTVFADRMTFPQGACWLNGSLYVCSPPGLWKLTDTDEDGVADEREMIVGGFDYTGNAADVHGPFLHPHNGRLYWCHGRKGHAVAQKDGTPVDESLASGIWSCEPDGIDVAWHSLGCGDNPVEVDFTPEGDVIGVQNLYYNRPRGDTIVHWLYGGVYERADQMKAIAHLPRTLEAMPVMHNFGHVAVSGCCFWKRYDGGSPLDLMVTHFNTQRVVRMELVPEGSTYKAVENEFLKIDDPDIHFTDVMEDPRDGSLLVLDTGGWFRIGCPASLMAKSDILGAVYRVKPKEAHGRVAEAWTRQLAPIGDLDEALALLGLDDLGAVRRGLLWIGENVGEGEVEAEAWDRLAISMRALLSRRLDPPALHAAILVSHQQYLVSYQDLKELRDPVAIRQGLLCFTPDDSASANLSLGVAKRSLDADDPELAEVALRFVVSHPDADEWIAPDLMAWLAAPVIADARLQALRGFCLELSSGGETAKLLAAMLRHESPAVEKVALDVIAARGTDLKAEDWLEAIDASWGESPSPSVLDAIKALGSDHFNERLMGLAADRSRPLAIRLKALAAVQGVELKGEVFEFVRGVLSDGASSPAAKIQAAEMLAAGPVKAETLRTIAPLFGSVGPVELKILIGMLRRVRDVDAARSVALALAQSPVLASRQESHYRQAFSGVPPEIFEDIVRPAYAKATEMLEAKRRGLSGLAAKAAVSGDMDAGSDHFAAGKGTCIACHRVGELGRAIGPDLTKIGAIRTERDLLESILFPSNTLARDYETHVIETDEGRQILGLIESHTAEGLLIVDAAGQKVSVSHEHIAGNTTLEMSLMPMGLDQTMSEQELLDLVAYLRSLK